MQSVNNLTVTRVRENMKALQLSDNEWYSTYTPMENPPAVGAVVSFQYLVKEYNGKNFRNIKSAIQVNAGATPAPSSPAAPSGGGGYREEDPVKQKSIIRQNAMRHAVPLVQMANTDKALQEMGVAEATQLALLCAAQIEEYTSGREDVAQPDSPPDFDDAIPEQFQG